MSSSVADAQTVLPAQDRVGSIVGVPEPSGWLDGFHPPLPARAIVVAPHPDDEVLGMAGLLCWLYHQGVQTLLVSVTDGEASHARSSRVSAGALVQQRVTERTVALARLGLGGLETLRLGHADGDVATTERLLAKQLAALSGEHTLIVVPWRHDSHPDHEAVGRAGAWASSRTGADLWEVPIWARVRRSLPPGTARLELGPAVRSAKAYAAHAYTSQLRPLGPEVTDGPVVHAAELLVMLGPVEDVLPSGSVEQ